MATPNTAWLLWRPTSVAMETPWLGVPPENPEHPPVAMVTPGITAPVAMETPVTPPPLFPVAMATACMVRPRPFPLPRQPPPCCHGDVTGCYGDLPMVAMATQPLPRPESIYFYSRGPRWAKNHSLWNYTDRML